MSRILTICTLSIFFLSFCPLHAEETPPAEIVQAAREGIARFLNSRPVSSLQKFGFRDQDEVNRATLGEGFQIYTVPPQTLLSGQSFQNFESIAVPTKAWQFLIRSGRDAKAFLRVDYINGQWQAVSLGSSGLAVQMDSIVKTWPPSAAYKLKFIRIYQAKSDFVEISSPEKIIGTIPMTSARVAMKMSRSQFDPRDIHGSSIILQELPPIVKAGIGNNR